LDEADRMLDMGFIHDIRKVLKVIPKKRQNLMFSATFSKEIKTLTQTILKDPITIEVAAENTTADTVEQQAYRIDKGNKPYLLKHLIQSNGWNQVLVFTRTKHGADKLAKRLEKAGIKSAAIHGNKSQNARVHALNRFKDMSIQALVATDIAARGIDIKELPHVVNYELPNVPEDYVHRIGRTGRAGSKGHAVSLVAEDERPYLSRIEKLMDQKVPLMKAPKFSGPPPQPQANASKKKSQRPERRDEPRGDARDAKLEGDANPKPKTTRYQKPKPQGKPGARPDKKNQTTTTGTKPKSNKRHGRLDERISKKTNPLNRKPQG
jgi:ATP-dependent RNA helicase RhlE